MPTLVFKTLKILPINPRRSIPSPNNTHTLSINSSKQGPVFVPLQREPWGEVTVLTTITHGAEEKATEQPCSSCKVQRGFEFL